jgi:hypothetical protein
MSGHTTGADADTEQVATAADGGGPPPVAQDLDYPALFVAADAASIAGRKGHTRMVVTDLALLAAAALVGVVVERVLALDAVWQYAAAAVLLALALLAKLATRMRALDVQWFDGRAVAETVKSATWRYVMRAPPYDGDDAAADDMLEAALRDVLAARPGLAPHLYHMPPEAEQITSSMRQARSLLVAERKQRYLSARVGDQAKWYSAKAAANAQAAARWFWVGLAAEGAALIIAIMLVARSTWPDLVAGLAAVAAVATAWTQFSRHDELSKSYALAAQELAFLRSEVARAETEETLRQTVADSEAAISREHTMWVARQG